MQAQKGTILISKVRQAAVGRWVVLAQDMQILVGDGCRRECQSKVSML